MMMAYTPAATAHAVAVLLSTEEAEGITGSISTVDHGSGIVLMFPSTIHSTYLRIASKIDFVDALHGRLVEHTHHQDHTPRNWGKCTRLTHLRHRIRTQNMRDTSGVNEHVTVQDHQRLSSELSAFTKRWRFSVNGRQDKTSRQSFIPIAVPAGCMPTEYRFGTIRSSQTSLVWSGPTLPQVFPRPQLGRLCSSIASSGRGSCISAHATCLPPVAPQKPDLQS